MTAPVSLIPAAAAQIRVSSTLNRDVRSYGKQFLTDGSDETCWNSDQGSPQHITIHLVSTETPSASERRAAVHELHLMFQGGFAGKECTLLGQSADDDSIETSSWETLMDFYPVDANHLQIFPVPESAQNRAWKRIRVLFKTSTDFYGRITIYRLDVLGVPPEA
ncbi:Nuclear receptor 2C2-associated protein [Geranomyces michiganensis]|nr:Nuclear receptor 2C2-associated protein [Geranomyces michiganensis]